jgi:3-dehydroquinate dehydratase II
VSFTSDAGQGLIAIAGFEDRRLGTALAQGDQCRVTWTQPSNREDFMTKPIYILNGPNLNLLGTREPELYGYETLEEVKWRCAERARAHDLEIDFRQSNFEGVLIESVHEAREKAIEVIINPAGLTFSSISLLDSLKTFEGPKIEVHITNIHKRESYYHASLISYTATGVIAGLGVQGYVVAVEAIANMISKK